MKGFGTKRENLNHDLTTLQYASLIDDFDKSHKKVFRVFRSWLELKFKSFTENAMSRDKINTPSSSQVAQPLHKT